MQPSDGEDEEHQDTRPDSVEDKCHLWPCNVAVYNLWIELQTQWQISMRGHEGLDYGSVLAYLRDIAHVRPRRLPEVFECIRAMERAALAAWAEQRP